MAEPKASRQVVVVVDSREASISCAGDYLAEQKKKAVAVIHSRKSSIATTIAGVLDQYPDNDLVLSVTLLSTQQLQQVDDLLRARKRTCKLLSYNLREDIGQENPVIDFTLNPLRRRAGFAAQGHRELRNWRQYRLMKLVISRTPLTGAWLKELIETTRIPDQDKLPTENFVKLGEPDMAGGTYGHEPDDGNPIDRLRKEITSMAATDFPVMIIGESGTGKEAAAWAIHELSQRRTKKYFAVNCAGFSEELAESLLFGHKKGAFTGAESDKAGLFREADGGTLFLDEFPNLSPSVQTKLLRCCETGEILPLGESTPLYVDVRIIAAAQPGRLYKGGKRKKLKKNIREDLVARLSALTLHMPALRSMEEQSPGSIAKVARVLLERLTWTTHRGNAPGEEKQYTPADIEQLMAVLDQKYLPAFSRLKWKGVNSRGLYNSIVQWLVMGEDYLDRQLRQLEPEEPIAAGQTRERGETCPDLLAGMVQFVRSFAREELPGAGFTRGEKEHVLSYYVQAVREVYPGRNGPQYQGLIGLSPPAISKYANLEIKNRQSYQAMKDMLSAVAEDDLLLANNSDKNDPEKNLIALYIQAVMAAYADLPHQDYAALLGITRETLKKCVR